MLAITSRPSVARGSAASRMRSWPCVTAAILAACMPLARAESQGYEASLNSEVFRGRGRQTKRVFYEDLRTAVDACSPLTVESAVGHVSFAALQTVTFSQLFGQELNVAKKMLSEASTITRNKLVDKPQMADYFACVAEKLGAGSVNPFEAARFFGVDLKTSRASLPSLGVRLTSEDSDSTFGAFVRADRITGEPSSTLERRFFYRDGYGLYRALLRLGTRGGQPLSPDEAALRYRDMAVKLTLANARIVRRRPWGMLDGLNYDDLRKCSGNADLDATLRAATDEDLRKLYLGEDRTPTEARFVAIYCGVMDEPRMEVAFDGFDDPQIIILTVIVTSPSTATVNLVLVDINIADFVVKERKQLR